jgi:predicted nucleotidyltransferase
MDGLSPAQEIVMERVLREEDARRRHAVVYLSGAHAYGFPSPDSDLDLKAVHIEKTELLLGLEPPSPTFDRAEIIDGVEIDYTSNELAHVLAGILAGNGNFIERVLGRLAVRRSPVLEEMRSVVRRSLSRRVHRHYRGFAHNQLQFFEREPSAKKLLYVLRTTLTGTHLLRTGELETDLTRLMDPYAVDARELVERKRAGERVGLDDEMVDAWRPRVGALFEMLDRALAESVLPESPPNEREIGDWLLHVRLASSSA